jgi:hypothetical protein
MFQYYKDVVLNSVDGIKVIDAYTEMGEATKALLIPRNGEYVKERIQPVYKASYIEPKPMTIKFDGAKLIEAFKDATGDVVMGTYQLSIDLKIRKTLAEFATANYAAFGRPVLVGFQVPANADAAAVIKAIYNGLVLAFEGNMHMLVPAIEEGATELTITATDPYMYVLENGVLIERYDPTLCDSCLGEYVALDATEGMVITKNVEPFATGEWMIENLRFPTALNTGYYSANDEMPVKKGKYVQYSFDYVTPRNFGGLSVAGQDTTSRTHHVFYVLEGDAATFEGFIEEIGVELKDAPKAE